MTGCRAFVAAALAAALVGAGLAACAPAAGGPGGPGLTAADFAAVERALLASGRLRAERAPADAPVGAATLARNFAHIAFGAEAHANRGRAAERLHRFEGPVRWWGEAAGPDAGAALRDVAETFARLARATGLDIAQGASRDGANLHVLFLGPEDHGRAAAWAARALGRPEAELIRGFRTRRALCTGSARVRQRDERGGRAGTHGHALVLVREGYSPLVRRGCVEEELAQVLGLANDHPGARPSVFNDDEEFALLTVHDELLLGILYDPRLLPGMTRAQAMPIVERIVRGMRTGP